MLAKKNRLNLSLEENSSIFAKDSSQIFVSDFFIAYLRRNETFLQASCLTPKAAINKAAHRNYIRRFMYSLLEENIKNNEISLFDKIDLTIVLKRKFPNDKSLLKKDFASLIRKIK